MTTTITHAHRTYHADFALKGAALHHLWSKAFPRPTRDLDIVAWGEPALPRMEEIFREICRMECQEDALRFDPASDYLTGLLKHAGDVWTYPTPPMGI
ncbi:nucleotidyl transferase AbiEii/AbiGii toxin family protein [Holophaga foetida]|uniref:nucleotidyl transferase AbiEii/AbiGii toxin family protein n=1 Tax=Holophaga foetida TaxID=35839 RepID=UPI0002475317